MNRRIAFIAFHSRANITTWFNSPLKTWVQNGYIVDVIVLKSDINSKFIIPHMNGEVFCIDIFQKRIRPRIISFIIDSLMLCHKRKYCCLVGFGQLGMIVAGTVSRILKIPFIFQSLELTFSNESKSLRQKIFKHMERFFNKRTFMTIIQDLNRAKLLADDNKISLQNILIVPNSPFGPTNATKSNYLRNKFGIENGKKIVLCCGSLTNATMITEIVRSVKSWPDEFVLVLHGWTDQNYKGELVNIVSKYPNKIFLSFDILPFEKVHLLFCSADIGLALYKNKNPNLSYTGESAGKIFYYLKHGIPFIASDLPGLRELVCQNSCGICINNVSFLGEGLEEIMRNFDLFKANSLDAFTNYEFSMRYDKVIRFFENKFDEELGND